MVEWAIIIFVVFIIFIILAAVSRSIGESENLYVMVNGQETLFIEPEKEKWMGILTSGLDRLKRGENILDYGLGRYYRQIYDRSLQSHVTKSVCGVLVLTNFRVMFLQRKRKAAFSPEYEYRQAITIPIPLIRYTDVDANELRIGTLRTMHGRKIENIDLEVEPPELAQIIRKQINDLAVQYKSIKKMEEAEKKENNIVMVQLRCPKCGGSLQPTAVKNVYECKFCDTTVMMKS